MEKVFITSNDILSFGLNIYLNVYKIFYPINYNLMSILIKNIRIY